MLYSLIISFITLLLGMTFHRKHLLLVLLCLEGMMLTIFLMLSLSSINLMETSTIYPLILLTMSACEAALGLSLMIATARSHGSDNLKTLNLLQC
uniref:NADH-ubiquinone oxidoreductase chain 4L n=1 Tax=Hyperolius marmoratus TaxID=476017 RepID=W0TIQ2_HYPMR|nr:NADH dehydrogenase subunit 4L [Hyperolius marmoratus]BAO42918.1 NADH dehydrogenase subunit 4L [Hyperolius marmoratus]